MHRNLASCRFEWSRTSVSTKLVQSVPKPQRQRINYFPHLYSGSYAGTIPTDRETFLLLTLWLISGSESPRCDVIWRVSCASSSNVTQQGVEGYRYQSYPMSPMRYLSPHCLAWRKSKAHENETNCSLPQSCKTVSETIQYRMCLEAYLFCAAHSVYTLYPTLHCTLYPVYRLSLRHYKISST